MKLSDIQRMIDISAVRTDVTEQEIDELVATADRSKVFWRSRI